MSTLEFPPHKTRNYSSREPRGRAEPTSLTSPRCRPKNFTLPTTSIPGAPLFMGPRPPGQPRGLPPRRALVGPQARDLGQWEGGNCIQAVSMAIGAGHAAAIGVSGKSGGDRPGETVFSSGEVGPQQAGPWAAPTRDLGSSSRALLPREGTPAPHNAPASPSASNPGDQFA